MPQVQWPPHEGEKGGQKAVTAPWGGGLIPRASGTFRGRHQYQGETLFLALLGRTPDFL